MNVALNGFTGANTLQYDWELDETPNSGSNCCNDLLEFTNQISDVTLTQGGLSFRLVISGFIPVASGTTCPAQDAGTPKNEFSTVEGQETHACLYAKIVQLRSLTVVKQITPGSPARNFDFTSSSSLAGSPWANAKFALASGGTTTRSLTSGENVTVTEVDPNDDRWSVTGLVCTQVGINGQPEPVPGVTVNQAARQVGADKRPTAATRRAARHHLHVHEHLHPEVDPHPRQAGGQRDRGPVAVDTHRDRVGRATAVGYDDLRSVGLATGHVATGSGRHLRVE